MIPTILGRKVQIATPYPRMVPSPSFQRIQSPELVASTAAWMAEFFGYKTAIPDNVIYELNRETLCMTQRTYDMIMHHGGVDKFLEVMRKGQL